MNKKNSFLLMKNNFSKLNIPLFIIIVLFYNLGFSQKNPSEWMKKAYEKFYSYDNLEIIFDYSVDQKKDINSKNIEGNIIFKKDKYHVYVGDIEQIFDNEKVYTIMKKDMEINITSPNDDKFLTPQKIFSNYNENYKLELDIIQNTPKGKIQFIKLTPKKEKTKIKFLYIGINSDSYTLHKLIEISKNGNTATLNIRELKNNQHIDNSTFIFDKKKFENSGFLINDLNF